MTIEVRQMVIKSSVGDERAPAPADAPRAPDLRQFREELLASNGIVRQVMMSLSLSFEGDGVFDVIFG